MQELTQFEIGYIMGLIVGEGSFTGDTRIPCLQIKLHTIDSEPILFLHRTLKGSLYGPYQHGGRNYRVLLVRGNSLKMILPFLEKYLPESQKRRQFGVWLEKYHLSFS